MGTEQLITRCCIEWLIYVFHSLEAVIFKIIDLFEVDV